MCTIILAHRIYPGTPLLVAANRDELLDRPAAGPRLLPVGGLEVFAPLDLLEGGTWLGLNSAGVFVGITNRFGAGRDADRRSRGELVFSALSEPTAIRAARRVGRIDPTSYNGFHLLMADRASATILWSDGARLHASELAPSVVWLTERSFGAAPSGREEYLRGRLALMETRPEPDEAALLKLMAHHATPAFDSLCVHLDAPRYGTRSTTIVRLRTSPAPSARFVCTDGPPCRTEPRDYSEDATAMLRRAQS